MEETAITAATAAPMKLLVSMPANLAFVIKDPKEQIVKVDGLGTEGDEVAGTGMESINGLWILPSRDPEKPITRLRLLLKSESAEVPRSFVLEDIALP